MGKKVLTIHVYTDGACAGNPGPGGWAALLTIKGIKKKKLVLKGGEKHTTNNRMELLAVIEALEFLKDKARKHILSISVYSDSSYVVNSINNGSLARWASNGWITTKKTDVVNRDLWERLMLTNNPLNTVKFIKVKGHSGIKGNEYVDNIASKQSKIYKKIVESER